MTRVLAVDDSPTIRMLLRSALVERGYDIVEAEDGLAALEALKTGTPDVVITDINMPRMDGFGLIASIREQACHSSLPILVLTTESSPEKRTRAREAGATGWIVKPFNPDKLDAAIRRVTA